MRHIRNYLILFFVSIFFICFTAFAGRINGLDEIYATSIPLEIRRNFDEYTQKQKMCPECKSRILDGEEFINIYTKKFLVISLEPNSFGGTWAVIAVKGEQWQVFKLWLYDVEQNIYDLRSVSRLSGSLDKEFIKELDNPQYSDYWL